MQLGWDGAEQQKTARPESRSHNRALYPYEVLQLADSIYPEAVSASLSSAIADAEYALSEAQSELEDILARSKGRKTKQVQAAHKAVADCEARIASAKRGVPELRAGWDGCHSQYRMMTRKFIKDVIAGQMIAQRVQRGLPPADDEEEAMEIQDQLDPDERESSACNFAGPRRLTGR